MHTISLSFFLSYLKYIIIYYRLTSFSLMHRIIQFRITLNYRERVVLLYLRHSQHKMQFQNARRYQTAIMLLIN